MVFKSKYSPLPGEIVPDFPVIRLQTPRVDTGAVGAARTLTNSPLCNPNLLKGVDGVATLPDSIAQLPGLSDIANGFGFGRTPSLDPRDMFTGLPTFTQLTDPEQILRWLGLPTTLNPQQILLAVADDVLDRLNITNPLTAICEELDQRAREADDALAISNVIDERIDINRKLGNTELPKFSRVTEQIPDLGET